METSLEENKNIKECEPEKAVDSLRDIWLKTLIQARAEHTKKFPDLTEALNQARPLLANLIIYNLDTDKQELIEKIFNVFPSRVIVTAKNIEPRCQVGSRPIHDNLDNKLPLCTEEIWINHELFSAKELKSFALSVISSDAPVITIIYGAINEETLIEISSISNSIISLQDNVTKEIINTKDNSESSFGFIDRSDVTLISLNKNSSTDQIISSIQRGIQQA